MISREMLEEMFENITEKSGWDLTQPMLWGFFFTHGDEATLRAAVPRLEALGYTFVDPYESDKDDEDDPDLWWLHVERVEIHSVDSLLARNEHLYEFAAKAGIDNYDGMDVGLAGDA